MGWVKELRKWDVSPCELASGFSHYGVVLKGEAFIESSVGSFRVTPGMYFCLPGQARVFGGRGAVLSLEAVCVMFHLGGPISLSKREVAAFLKNLTENARVFTESSLYSVYQQKYAS